MAGLRAVELFAGVGGFRLGLQAAGHQVVWWNQWEPSTSRVQYAYDCYRANFHDGATMHRSHNADISTVSASEIPEHDLLVGGFPCQDYSVMTSLKRSQGLQGKKGVLWWEIRRILAAKRPNFLLLENVGRLLHSPKNQPGRDFAVMLASLAKLGYAVEWRTITADDYGHCQRRTRVFIFGARLSTPLGKWMNESFDSTQYLTKHGFFAKPFGVRDVETSEYAEAAMHLRADLAEVSDHYDGGRFASAGLMVRRRVRQLEVSPRSDLPSPRLYNIVSQSVPERKYFLSVKEYKKWKEAKDTRKVTRTVGSFSYTFSEGKLPCPDNLDRSARTLLTSEGSRTPSRTTHVIWDPNRKRPRLLTPEECEAINGFPPGWTAARPAERKLPTPDRWRYFMMGNALVVGLIEAMGHRLAELVRDHPAETARTISVSRRAISHSKSVNTVQESS